MSLNLSIKGVPEGLTERLRARARRNHRSLQGELMAIIERAAAGDDADSPPTVAPQLAARPLVSERRGTRTIEEIAAEHRARYPKPFTDVPRAVDIIRRDRDSR